MDWHWGAYLVSKLESQIKCHRARMQSQPFGFSDCYHQVHLPQDVTVGPALFLLQSPLPPAPRPRARVTSFSGICPNGKAPSHPPQCPRKPQVQPLGLLLGALHPWLCLTCSGEVLQLHPCVAPSVLSMVLA